MKWTSALAIYFIIWWTVLFAVLPLRVRNASETGETVVGGNDAGAPVAHGLVWKAKITTLVACAVFALVYVFVNLGGMDAFSQYFLPDMKL